MIWTEGVDCDDDYDDDDDGAVYGDHVVDSGDSHGRSSWPLQVWF